MDMLIKNDQNGSFVDQSVIAKDYLRDDFNVLIESGVSELYIGLYKPFNSFYVEQATFVSSLLNPGFVFEINSNAITVEDDTQELKRSGFMLFEKPESWVKETIDGVEAFWLKISNTGDAVDINARAINIVFSDDNDLEQEVRNITDLLAKNDTTFIAYHVAARNEIIQTLRNGGHTKMVDDLIRNITKWDILSFGEIRQASKYLTLSKIFFDASSNVEDKFYSKFRDYQGMFGKAFDLWIMSLDTKDDGIYNQDDDLVDNSIEIIRA